MKKQPDFDVEQAHRHFAAYCFNEAWVLLDAAAGGGLSAENAQSLIQQVHASLYHWSQRPDCTDRNRSIGYWQASRAYAVIGESANAQKYAALCLAITPNDAFLLGYANEAAARAAQVAGDADAQQTHLAQAIDYAKRVTNENDKQLLLDDLKSLGAGG